MELLIFYYVKMMARLKFGKEKVERKLKKLFKFLSGKLNNSWGILLEISKEAIRVPFT